MKKSSVVMLAVMAALIASGWYLIESWGIWLIVAAAVLAGTMIVSNKTGRKGWMKWDY